MACPPLLGSYADRSLPDAKFSTLLPETEGYGAFFLSQDAFEPSEKPLKTLIMPESTIPEHLCYNNLFQYIIILFCKLFA